MEQVNSVSKLTALDRLERLPSVSSQDAMELLQCGRFRLFELLRQGRLRRAARVGRRTMVTSASVKAVMQGKRLVGRQPKPRRPDLAGDEARAAPHP